MATDIAKRYARALLEALPLDRAQENRTQLEEISQIFEKNELLKTTLVNPRVPLSQRIEIAKEVAERIAGKDSAVANTVAILTEKHRLSEFTGVAKAFAALVDELSKTLSLSITTAFPVSEIERAELLNVLQSKFGGLVSAEWKVDSELLGGIKIQAGDKVLDNSIRTVFEAAKAELLA